jgi:ribonuclease HII
MPLNLENLHEHHTPEFHHFNYGERYSSSIAAASIVAKVTRDRLMRSLNPSFPLFSLEQHKGYATKQHISALLANGPTIIHRNSFISEIKTAEDVDRAAQQTLF